MMACFCRPFLYKFRYAYFALEHVYEHLHTQIAIRDKANIFVYFVLDYCYIRKVQYFIFRTDMLSSIMQDVSVTRLFSRE
jgi:hypothetical protein